MLDNFEESSGINDLLNDIGDLDNDEVLSDLLKTRADRSSEDSTTTTTGAKWLVIIYALAMVNACCDVSLIR